VGYEAWAGGSSSRPVGDAWRFGGSEAAFVAHRQSIGGDRRALVGDGSGVGASGTAFVLESHAFGGEGAELGVAREAVAPD
jgi:hypothetical protein